MNPSFNYTPLTQLHCRGKKGFFSRFCRTTIHFNTAHCTFRTHTFFVFICFRVHQNPYIFIYLFQSTLNPTHLYLFVSEYIETHTSVFISFRVHRNPHICIYLSEYIKARTSVFIPEHINSPHICIYLF